MYAAVALKQMSEMAETVWQDRGLADRAAILGGEIREGIERYGITDHGKYGRVYVYEADGLGNTLLMDDAGIPGLLSMPYFGYCDASDPVYQNTRRLVLSSDNPCFYEGTRLTGIGSPHTKPGHVWPMSLIIQALTSDDDAEIERLVRMLVENDAGTGYIHESIHKDDERIYTRPWFAWVNSLFSEMLMKKIMR